MKCPFCQNSMEVGVITSSEPLNWLKEPHYINQPQEEGEFNLARPSLAGRAAVEAWVCRDCEKVIIDYKSFWKDKK
ncbi:MAG: hypothetical protein IKD66_05390 [Solobacterium sp.]|nr:hypothetical protein [Solobacterium sp.]